MGVVGQSLVDRLPERRALSFGEHGLLSCLRDGMRNTARRQLIREALNCEILRLAVPAFGALVAEPLFLLADSAIVGHLGTPQLAGLGVAGTILGAAVSLSIFLAYGTTGAVARMLGAGNRTGALQRGIDGLWLAGMMGMAFALLGTLSAPSLVGLFHAGPAASPLVNVAVAWYLPFCVSSVCSKPPP